VRPRYGVWSGHGVRSVLRRIRKIDPIRTTAQDPDSDLYKSPVVARSLGLGHHASTMGMVGIFMLGFLLSGAFDLWLRRRFLDQCAPRCAVTGCNRPSDSVTFVTERGGLMRVKKVWGLCQWCASSTAITVRGEGLS
jgi:hypothetical protein